MAATSALAAGEGDPAADDRGVDGTIEAAVDGEALGALDGVAFGTVEPQPTETIVTAAINVAMADRRVQPLARGSDMRRLSHGVRPSPGQLAGMSLS
jgi:hypothetical protein